MPVRDDDFTEFYQATYDRVVALVAAMVGDRHQAEDIAQEAFGRALIRWPRVARYDLPEAWVRQVAIRLTIDASRRVRRAIRLSARLAGRSGAAEADPLAATTLSVALMRLPLAQRQVLVLYYLADLPVEEIARDCGISAGTVRTRLAVARQRLERELSESDEVRTQLAARVRPVTGRPAPDVQEVRRRARRHGLRRAALAAGATVVVVAVVAAVVLASPWGPGRLTTVPTPGGLGGSAVWSAAPGTWHPGTWRPAGALPAADAGPDVAPYFVTIAGDGSASVTDAFTGRVTGTVLAPGRGSVFAGVAAAGDDRTFVLAARISGAVGFYELRLGSDGRVVSLSRLFTLPIRTVPTFAVSPDARLLGYVTPGGIEVVSLATRTGRSWTAAGGQAYGLSWGGDGTLAFEWDSASASRPPGAGCGCWTSPRPARCCRRPGGSSRPARTARCAWAAR